MQLYITYVKYMMYLLYSMYLTSPRRDSRGHALPADTSLHGA
jgi:hypothetical protein